MRWRTWRRCLHDKRTTRSTLRRWPKLICADTAPGWLLWLRNLLATEFESRAARPPRASPRGEPFDRPRSTRTLADLPWLSSRQMHDALQPTPLAVALLHRHPARSATAAPVPSDRSVRIPCRAARARCAPWKTGRLPTDHARAGGLGVVVFAANAGRTPPLAVGRGNSAPAPRQVGGVRLEAIRPQFLNPVPRGPRALRPVENRPSVH